MADLDLNELERLEQAADILRNGRLSAGTAGNADLLAFDGNDVTGIARFDNPTRAAYVAALCNALPELLRRLRAAESDNANLLRQLLRVVGDHSAPKDCYSTGPLTGTALDHSCPSCEALSMLAARKP